MIDDTPLYNSRITQIYLEYLSRYYPDLEIDKGLEYAGILRYEVEDPAHWFTQNQVDRFHEYLVRETGNTGISREAGRYAASAGGMGAIKQFTLGLMSFASVYQLVGKISSSMSRNTDVTVRNLDANSIEITFSPKPGVHEKPYQCENRLGSLESVGKLFTDELSKVEHPSCLHRGDRNCRYIVTWPRSRQFIFRRARNYSIFAGILTCAATVFFLPFTTWLSLALGFGAIALICALQAEAIENKSLSTTIKSQGDAARNNLEEINIRYNNALFFHEIGLALSSISDAENMIQTVMKLMSKRLDFDRGMILLADPEKECLVYRGGYGFSAAQEKAFRAAMLPVGVDEIGNTLTSSFKEKKPLILNNPKGVMEALAQEIPVLEGEPDLYSFLCAPIIYKEEVLGLLTVYGCKPGQPLNMSDLNLMMGVAAEIGVGLINVRSFQKIQESEREYRELVESASSIIMKISTSGTITFMNQFAIQFLGYEHREILGKNILGTIIDDSRENRDTLGILYEKLLEHSDRQFVMEGEIIRKGGLSAWINWTFRSIFDSQGNTTEVLAIGNDITEIKASRRERKFLEESLNRAQKMEAIGTLAGGVAHDLNNILSGIVSYPDLILMDLPEDSPLRKPILTIQKSGEKAASIVQDLLTLARRGIASMEVLNLNEVVTKQLASPEFKKLLSYHPEVMVETDLDSDLMNIVGSPVHLGKTLMNLVSNAMEATTAGGRVLISTENRYIDIPVSGYDSITEGDYVILKVSDNGIGIASEDMQRIFEPFFTKKEMGRSGSGLGMAVVWGTVKDHNGYVNVQSETGKGTTLNLYFPISRKLPARDTDSRPLEQYKGHGQSILVVDDVEEQREIACSILTRLGYSTVSVSSGEEAVEFLKTHSVDLIVLDMIMDPGIDGLDTYLRIIEEKPQQRVIISSGFSESERVRRAHELGAGAYLKKPYTIEKLGVAVKNELER